VEADDCGCKTVNVKRVVMYAALYALVGAAIGAGLAIYTQKAEDSGIIPDILTQRGEVLKAEIAKHKDN
jgi:hypothetical protein